MRKVIDGVSSPAERLEDEPAVKMVYSHPFADVEANVEEVGLEVVAVVVEALQPFLEGFECLFG